MSTNEESSGLWVFNRTDFLAFVQRHSISYRIRNAWLNHTSAIVERQEGRYRGISGSAEPVDFFVGEQQTRGYDRYTIFQALQRTSYHFGRANDVLEFWKTRDGLPHRAGIWSQQADDEATGSDDGARQRLRDFHGDERFETRLEMLSAWHQRRSSRLERKISKSPGNTLTIP